MLIQIEKPRARLNGVLKSPSRSDNLSRGSEGRRSVSFKDVDEIIACNPYSVKRSSADSPNHMPAEVYRMTAAKIRKVIPRQLKDQNNDLNEIMHSNNDWPFGSSRHSLQTFTRKNSHVPSFDNLQTKKAAQLPPRS